MVEDVKWKASKAVRTVVSSVSLMTLLTSDHLECCCSAVMICIQYHEPEQLLWCQHESTNHQHMKTAVNLAHLIQHYYV
jgi:hypothetical protein